MRALVTYASKHGSTKDVAARLAARLRALDVTTDLAPVEEAPDLGGYDAIVLGSPIYYGRWPAPATRFLADRAPGLGGRPLWLFSVGPLGDQPVPAPPAVLPPDGPVQPCDHRVFHGALDPALLSGLERAVAKVTRAPVGDFRPWDEIDAWAAGIARDLEHRAARVPRRPPTGAPSSRPAAVRR